MRSRRARAPEAVVPDAPPAPEDGYRSLSIEAVLADLASLSTDQLLLVKSLEESGDHRAVILDRIDDLLVVHEATHHILQAATASPVTPPAPPPPTAPATPGAPSAPVGKPVSPDLVDQMGGLLAKDAARRSPAAEPPPPPPAGFVAAKKKRVSHHGRATKILVVLVILAMIGAVGGVFWKQRHKTTSSANQLPAGQPTGSLADLIVAHVAGSFTVTRGSGPVPASAGSAANGFVGGYHREWQANVGHEYVSVTLSKFQTPADATAAATTTVALVNRAMTVSHDPAGIAGATGLTGTGTATDAFVIFPQGIYQVVVQVQGPEASVAPEADSVATAQSALLPAS